VLGIELNSALINRVSRHSSQRGGANSSSTHLLWRLHNSTVALVSDSDRWAKALEPLLASLPFRRLTQRSGRADITIRVSGIVDFDPDSVTAGQANHCFGVDIYHRAEDVVITDGASVFIVQPSQRAGTLYLHGSYLQKPLRVRLNLFLIGLIELLASGGYYDLHAAALVHEDKGYLFVGESGSGKSTTALTLVRQGWHYVSDDAVLLQDQPGAIKALSFRKTFNIDAHLTNNFPEIRHHLLGPVTTDNPKRFLDVERVYGNRFEQSCIPARLIFTALSSEASTTLVPLSSTEALVGLIRQSPSLAFRRNQVSPHLEMLRRLAEQASAHRLKAGQDVYQAPEKLADLLSGIG
jgi:hypothetical protein